MNHTETNEDWEKKFDSTFEKGYCGECGNFKCKSHASLAIKSFIRSLRQSDKELILGKMEEELKEEPHGLSEMSYEEPFNNGIDTCKSIVEEVMK